LINSIPILIGFAEVTVKRIPAHLGNKGHAFAGLTKQGLFHKALFLTATNIL